MRIKSNGAWPPVLLLVGTEKIKKIYKENICRKIYCLTLNKTVPWIRGIVVKMMSFPRGSGVKNLPAKAGDTRHRGFDPWAKKVP